MTLKTPEEFTALLDGLSDHHDAESTVYRGILAAYRQAFEARAVDYEAAAVEYSRQTFTTERHEGGIDRAKAIVDAALRTAPATCACQFFDSGDPGALRCCPCCKVHHSRPHEHPVPATCETCGASFIEIVGERDSFYCAVCAAREATDDTDRDDSALLRVCPPSTASTGREQEVSRTGARLGEIRDERARDDDRASKAIGSEGLRREGGPARAPNVGAPSPEEERKRFEEWLRIVEPHATRVYWLNDHTPVAVVGGPDRFVDTSYALEWAAWQARASAGREGGGK